MLRELAGAVRGHRVSAVELVQQALERIERLNPTLGAVVALRAEEATAEAKALDERLGRGDRPTGPLAGVPFLVKDNMDIAGLPTCQGSLLLADVPRAARDNLTPARLRAAGAIAVGKTNVPEFCIEGFTDNRLFGTTRNPWALPWSPGGSSGGTAAAMAAGMIPFGTATDGGGSVRIPAAYCGLFGLKPTVGVIARDPIPPWMDYSTDGLIGLSIDDVRLLLSVQAGPWPGDPTALPVPSASVDGSVGSGRADADDGDTLPRPSVVYAAPRFVDWGPLPAAIDQLFRRALADLEGTLGSAPRVPGAWRAVAPRQRRRRLVRHGLGRARRRAGARGDRDQCRKTVGASSRVPALWNAGDDRRLPGRSPAALRLRA